MHPATVFPAAAETAMQTSPVDIGRHRLTSQLQPTPEQTPSASGMDRPDSYEAGPARTPSRDSRIRMPRKSGAFLQPQLLPNAEISAVSRFIMSA